MSPIRRRWRRWWVSGWVWMVFKHCAVSLHICQQFARDLNKPPPACIALPETPRRLTAEDAVVLSDCIAVWSWGVFTSPARQCSDVPPSVTAWQRTHFAARSSKVTLFPFLLIELCQAELDSAVNDKLSYFFLVGMQISFRLLWHNTLNFCFFHFSPSHLHWVIFFSNVSFFFFLSACLILK